MFIRTADARPVQSMPVLVREQADLKKEEPALTDGARFFRVRTNARPAAAGH